MSATSPAPQAAQTKLRALVVDDVPEICGMYQSIFKRIRGLDVELTIETDPAAAIERLREGTFDVVVSDFRMKGGDGIDVLTAARSANPQGRRVLMTGYNEVPTSIERIRSARVDAYLQKPLKTQDLLILVGHLLKNDPEALAPYREHAGEIEQVALREEANAKAA